MKPYYTETERKIIIARIEIENIARNRYIFGE